MPNRIYPPAKAAFLRGEINLVTDTIRVQLIDTGAYVYSDAHEFLAAVPAAARVGNPATLTNKAVSANGGAGVFDADDTLLTAVPDMSGTADQSEALLIYKDTGDPATSRLIQLLEDGQGLPVTTNGGNVAITWDATGILRLA